MTSRLRDARPCILLAGLLLLAACSGGTSTDAEERDPGAVVREGRLGPVSATVRMNPAEPRFGDRIQLTLDVSWEPGAKVGEARVGSRLGHLRVRGRRGPEGEDSGAARYVVEAEPERSGVNIVRFPDIPFTILEGEGKGQDRVLHLEPLEITVQALAEGTEPDLANLGPALPPVLLPPPERETALYWIFGGALAVLGCVGWFFWRRRRSGAETGEARIDPVAEAREALARLLARGLAEAGLFGEFYLHLTAIVRRFIERTTGLHAPEQTTEEFLRAMESDPRFPDGRRTRLLEFLEAADLVKFAAQVPTSSSVEQAVASTRLFCELDENREAAA